MGERVCKQCGKSLEQKDIRSLFCNSLCRSRYYAAQSHVTIPEKVCVVCGKSFVPHNPRHVCCSNECSVIRKKAKNVAYCKEHYQKIKKQNEAKICVICGASFIPEHNQAICCSYACSKKRNKETARNWKREKRKECVTETHELVTQCIICGRSFVPRKATHVICSHECRRKRKAEMYEERILQARHAENTEAGAVAMLSCERVPPYMAVKYEGFG